MLVLGTVMLTVLRESWKGYFRERPEKMHV